MGQNRLIKNVLIIAYIFPPMGGSGVQRTLKFVKYLPDLGWLPFVICGKDPDIFNDGLDHSLLVDIPNNIKVCRSRSLNPLTFRRKIKRIFTAEVSPNNNQLSDPLSAGIDSTHKYKNRLIYLFLRKFSKLLNPLEFPPIDAALYWSLSIIPLCLRIIKEHQIDLIYSTSFPYSDHVTGLVLKRITGKPWVVDFRDPWSQNAFGQNFGWRRRIDKIVERWVLEKADKIIAVTPSYTQGFRGLYSERDFEDFITIENGFDETDFLVSEGNKKGLGTDKITISHIGYVYDGIVLPFFYGLNKLTQDEISKLNIVFVGGIAETEQNWLEEHHFNAYIQIMDRVPHLDAIRYMQSADFLLLTVGNSINWAGHYPGKMFEYMRAGKPIFMIGPEGDASRLILESGTGCFFPAEDINSLAAGLRSLVNNPHEFQENLYKPVIDVINNFERKKLTSRLAKEFDSLI